MSPSTTSVLGSNRRVTDMAQVNLDETKFALQLHNVLQKTQESAQNGKRSAHRELPTDAHCGATTLMLRNIPNKYTQPTLQQEIDDNGFAGTYDFLYLPFGLQNKSNVGYAFINCHTPEAAQKFRAAFAAYRFKRFRTQKIGSVCDARIQGLQANLQHFAKRKAWNDKNCPLVFDAPVTTDNVDCRPPLLHSKAETGKTKRGYNSPVQQHTRQDSMFIQPRFEEEEVEEDLGPDAAQVRLELEASVRKLLDAFRGDPLDVQVKSPDMNLAQPFSHPPMGFTPHAADTVSPDRPRHANPQREVRLQSPDLAGTAPVAAQRVVGISNRDDVAELLTLKSMLVQKLHKPTEDTVTTCSDPVRIEYALDPMREGSTYQICPNDNLSTSPTASLQSLHGGTASLWDLCIAGPPPGLGGNNELRGNASHKYVNPGRGSGDSTPPNWATTSGLTRGTSGSGNSTPPSCGTSRSWSDSGSSLCNADQILSRSTTPDSAFLWDDASCTPSFNVVTHEAAKRSFALSIHRHLTQN